jgi:isocitrate dehydrogenase
MESYIVYKPGRLEVPDNPCIPYIEGDGIGPEIWKAAKAVTDAAVAKSYGGKRSITWQKLMAGQEAFAACGDWLPQAAIESISRSCVAIKGPLATPVGGGIRSVNVKLRQALDLYACVRPVRYFPGVPSPLRKPENVDMRIFRENTEDIYAGIEFQCGSQKASLLAHFIESNLGETVKSRFGNDVAIGIKPVSKQGSERLVRAALEYAVGNRKPSVTIVHKGNIMKFTEGAFLAWGYAVAETEFPASVFTMQQYARIEKESGAEKANDALQQAKDSGKVIVKDCICDAFLQETLLRPQEYSVIATLNLNGDYISDQLAAMVGGIGIAPGANINYSTGCAVFEATHGTAPSIAGLGVANPSSLLLSAAMMLGYIGWTEAESLIEDTLAAAYASGVFTGDLAAQQENSSALSTEKFAQALIGLMG